MAADRVGIEPSWNSRVQPFPDAQQTTAGPGELGASLQTRQWCWKNSSDSCSPDVDTMVSFLVLGTLHFSDNSRRHRDEKKFIAQF